MEEKLVRYLLLACGKASLKVRVTWKTNQKMHFPRKNICIPCGSKVIMFNL